jgi:hypothetical protein
MIHLGYSTSYPLLREEKSQQVWTNHYLCRAGFDQGVDDRSPGDFQTLIT